MAALGHFLFTSKLVGRSQASDTQGTPLKIFQFVAIMRSNKLAEVFRGSILHAIAIGLVFAIITPSIVFGEAVFSGAAEPAKFENWSVVGPDGGDVRTVTIDPRDPDRLYISTLDGQIHTSGNGGKTWRLLVNLNQPELIIDDLFVDSVDSQYIYASGHRHKGPGGFFRSTDGGATWTEAKELRKESIHALTQSTADPKVLLAGAVTGVWISKNRGQDWERIDSPTNPINIDSLAVDPRNTSTLYAGTWWRAYKSTDSGKNWRLIRNGMIDDSDVFAMKIDSTNPEHIISSACSGIYESFNGGEKWTKIQGIPSQSRRTRDILKHPTIPTNYYAATTEGFWMSTNAGKSWAMTTPRTLEINSIAVHPSKPDRIFIGTNNSGVMVSNDAGRSFTPTNTSFTSRFTYSIVADREQPSRLYAATKNVATGGGFVFVSTNGGASWTQARSIDPTRLSPFAILQDRVNANLLYLGTNKGLFRSYDRGVSWTAVPGGKKAAAAPVKKAPAKKGAAKPVVAAPAVKWVAGISEQIKVLASTEDGKNGLIAGTDRGLFRTYDIAKGWEKLNLGVGINENIFAVHISAARPDTIWVGTATSGVLVSHDGGKTFAKAGGANEGAPISTIVSDPKRPDYVYVGTSQTFFYSRNGGSTWTRRGGGLPIGNYTSILVNPENTDELIVSSSYEANGGIYVSTDAGDKWKRVDEKEWLLPSRRVWSLTFDPRDNNRIFAGTHSSGVYRIERRPTSALTSAQPAVDDRPRVTSN